jgi:vacuolar-type H+-ATPase subunit E/Vma4
MSVEAIVQLIEREAAAEATRIVAEGEARASSLVDDAETAAAERVAAAVERAEPAIRAEATRRVNAARLHLLERRAAETARRIDAVMAAAHDELDVVADATDRRRWAVALESLAAEAMAAVGPGAVVRVRAIDAPLVAGIVAARGGRLEPIEDRDAAPGLRASAPDGRIEVDARLDARLGRARVRLVEDVARTLGLAG